MTKFAFIVIVLTLALYLFGAFIVFVAIELL